MITIIVIIFVIAYALLLISSAFADASYRRELRSRSERFHRSYSSDISPYYPRYNGADAWLDNHNIERNTLKAMEEISEEFLKDVRKHTREY